MYNLIQSLGK